MNNGLSQHTTLNEDLSPSALELYDKAFKLYGSVFWNMKPLRNMNGYRSAINALYTRGNLAAARLADQMEKAIYHAT